ncbi:MAG: M23 family metallopeptidase [bacterium]|nr:M23 family metallopeptidase [bacterium]
MNDLGALVVASPFIPLIGIAAASLAVVPYRTAALGPRLLFAMFATVIGAMIASFKGFSAVEVNAGFLLACILISLWPFYYVLQARRAPAPEGAVEMAPPFTGRWRCASGGAVAMLNHHLDSPAQRYAYDFYAPNAVGWPGAPWARTNDRYLAYGKDVLAPAEGRVLRVVDGQPDGLPPRPAPDAAKRPFGNHVVIEIAGGYLVLAHLKPGSVRVKSGEAVKRGDRLAACGNSGESTMPHVHVHLQEKPQPGKGRGVPLVFRDTAGRLVAPVTGQFLVG